MNRKSVNQRGFSDLMSVCMIAAFILLIFIGYNSISGKQKINKIQATLDSIVLPANLKLEKKECSGAGIDTQAMCNYRYIGSATFESSKQIADQLIAKGYVVLDKREDVSYIRLWQLKGDGNIISISVLSGNTLDVNSEANASKD